MGIETLRSQLEQLCRLHPVEIVYLFGSQVTGHIHEESDVDVAVLLNEELSADERFAERLELVGQISRILGTDRVDILILNEAPPLLAYEVTRNGVLIFCAHDDVHGEFLVRTLRRYEDTEPLRRLLAEAMAARIKAGAFGKSTPL